MRDEYLRYAPDVPVTGVIGHGGSMDLTALLRDSPSFAPMLLTSFTRTAKHDAAFAQVISVLHGRATQLPRLTRRVR